MNIIKLYHYVVILRFNTSVQNICNLIGREEYNIGCVLLSTSMFYSLTKKATFECIGRKKLY